MAKAKGTRDKDVGSVPGTLVFQEVGDMCIGES